MISNSGEKLFYFIEASKSKIGLARWLSAEEATCQTGDRFNP